MLSCGSRGLASVMAGRRQQSGMRVDQDVERSHLEPEAQSGETGTLGIVRAFGTSKLMSNDVLTAFSNTTLLRLPQTAPPTGN